MNNSNVIENTLRSNPNMGLAVADDIIGDTNGAVYATDVYMQNGYIIVIGDILDITFEYTYCIMPELEGSTSCIQLSIDKQYCNLLMKAARAVLTSYMEDDIECLFKLTN